MIKIQELVNSKNALIELKRQSLPVMLSFKIAKVTKKIDEELIPYDEVRVAKIKELGAEVKDKDGKLTGEFGVDISDKENYEKFVEFMEELGSHEVELEIPEIKSDDFPANVMLSTDSAERLVWLIQD